ncbi:hypothetical protein [Rhodococcus erythropolis]|nr:hypothetical protein [Rhodococcus erythropolis]OFV77054.1 hypothetical protein RERY_22170 [Rhodococcus erythropolis]
MTLTEGLLIALLVGQSIAWICTDFRRFDPTGGKEHDRSIR